MGTLDAERCPRSPGTGPACAAPTWHRHFLCQFGFLFPSRLLLLSTCCPLSLLASLCLPALLPVLRPGPSSHLCHSQGAFPARGHTESSPRVQTHAPHFTRGPSTYVSFTKLSERPAWEASLSARQLGSRPEIVPGTSNHPH